MSEVVAEALREIARLADCPDAYSVNGKSLSPMTQISYLARQALESGGKPASDVLAESEGMRRILLARAAPGMLEALHRSLPVVEDMELDQGYKPGYVAGIVQQIRSAIDMAEGRI